MDNRAKYQSLLARWMTERPRSAPEGVTETDLPETSEPCPGGTQFFRNKHTRIAKALSEQVLHDNTQGIVYPGALLWTKELMQGRLDLVRALPHRAPTKVTADMAGEGPIAGSFSHDGSFSSFRAGQEQFLRDRKLPVSRVTTNVSTYAQHETALLEFGMSAKGWGQSFEFDYRRAQSSNRAFAMLLLDQVYYSMIMDAPDTAGVVPLSIFDADNDEVQYLLTQMETHGELGYVRAVKYGRRVIFSAVADASTEDLRMALAFAGGFGGVSLDSKYADTAKRVWSSMEVRATVIGGGVSKELERSVQGNLKSFGDSINEFLRTAETEDRTKQIVPLSFEVRYAADDGALQTFETAEFSGRIPTIVVPDPKTVSMTVALNPSDAAVVRSDAEVDSDDWTGVEVGYSFAVSADRRSVDLTVTMDVRELEDDKKYDNKTHIRTTHTFPAYSVPAGVGYVIDRVLDAPASSKRYASGEVRTVSFDALPPGGGVGILKNIRATVDSNGSDDRAIQRLTADASFRVKFVRA